MIWFFLECRQIFDKYVRDEVSVYAAQASFFIILAAFPFLMLLLALIQIVPVVSVSDLFAFIVNAVPDSLDAIVIRILESLYSDSPIALLSATALAALWSAARGMLSIERGLNRIYEVSDQRNYVVRRLICSFYTIILTFMCVLCLILLVFGDSLQRLIISLIPMLSDLSFLITSVRNVGSLVLLVLFFLMIYTILPFKKLRIRSQIPGSVFSAIGWVACSVAISIYFRHFRRFAITYGSLTAVILFMLWIYFCMIILFIGAEINRHLDR